MLVVQKESIVFFLGKKKISSAVLICGSK